MSAQEWADVLPRLAERVAADTGRDLAAVEAFLDACYHADPADVDVDELVAVLAPTMAKLMGPTLLDVLTRMERLAREDRLPCLAPLVLGILPRVVAAALVAERGRAADGCG
ncbi:hypothetical protein ACQEVF_59665 [Nonomuraea polychroma]|uniref:hypothetical protein n=1 Tax=Nonomuraea polychroma TaxID=46176 RepID=UPI003D9403FA